MKKVLHLLTFFVFAGLAAIQATETYTHGDYTMTTYSFNPELSGGPSPDIVLNIIPITDGEGGADVDDSLAAINPYPANTEGLVYVYDITHIPSGNTLHIRKRGRWFTVNHELAFEMIHDETGNIDGIAYELSPFLFWDLYGNSTGERADFVDLTTNYFDMVDALGMFIDGTNTFGSASFFQGMDTFIRQLPTNQSCGAMWGHLPDLEWDQLHKAVKLMGSGTADGAFMNSLFFYEAMILHPCL